jgi:CBS domain-containing protein
MRHRLSSSIRSSLRASAIGSAAALLCQAAFAASAEETMSTVTLLMFYGSIAFALIVVASVYFMRPQDKRLLTLREVFKDGEPVHAVGSDTPIAECVREMTAKKIGALVIVDGQTVKGIFTERDAMNRVLAAGLDPLKVKVSEVMTRDPTLVPPGTTVGAAMELITKRRFRHLPIVENGKLLAVVSSGDLTRWMVKDKMGDVQDLVSLAAQD